MKRILVAISCLLLATSLWAQKQPQPKSQKEVDALMAIQNAQDPDTRIKAVDDLLVNFADTDFKSFALMMATDAARQKGDFEKIVIYGERALEADPKAYAVMLMMASSIAQRTREHDLDREEKLGRAEKLANDAGEILKTAPKMNPQLTDEQWAQVKNDFVGQQHEALGLVALGRKKYDDAANAFKAANEASGEPAHLVRQAQALNLGGKHDEAIAICDKVMAISDAHPQIKQVAQAERARATQAKGAKK